MTGPIWGGRAASLQPTATHPIGGGAPAYSRASYMHVHMHQLTQETDAKIRMIFEKMPQDRLRALAGNFTEKQMKKIERTPC